MKVKSIGNTLALLFMLCGMRAFAQVEPQVMTIPLSNPGEPIVLDISILSARIEVIGEDRDDAEFSVSVLSSERKIVTPSGTQPITIGAYSLEIDEDDNHISVDTDWRANKVNIVARIPRRADLELSTVNDGEILVNGIVGHLELENTNGPITATNISGSIIAEALNDTIDVSFVELDESSAMSLNSLNGDLIFGLPESAGAQFHLDSAKGELYSDFEVDVQTTKPIVERRDGRGGVEVRVESVIVVNVNGGGPVVRMKSLNGDIQIKKIPE